MRIPLLIIFISIVIGATSITNCFSQTVLTNAHAHNDYWHARPLFQSLENGFMSIEADCHLIDGEILVAHEKAFTKKRRTLQKLYLDPLMHRAKENNFKSIYKTGEQEFILYIDIKADCENFIPFLDSILKTYDAMLTKFVNGKKTTGAVRVLVDHCGNDSYVLNSKTRYLSLSGNMGDAGKNHGNDIMPRISFSYNSLLQWKGRGEMSEAEKEKLKAFMQKAHSNDYEVRMWAAGNKKKVWKELVAAGVDWINVDRLKKFRKFMSEKD
jgi:glycerophosphoryl diester phosphodiesterase